MFDSILRTLLDEFADLNDVASMTRVVVRLTLAALLGGALGLQRERRRKPAGLRTHILVALGSATCVLVPEQMHMNNGDVTRVIQGLITGIGFLGTGAIIKSTRHPHDHVGEVSGLTTAAGIWVTAAIGISAGLGRGATAVLATALALVVLALLPKHVREVPP